MFSGCNKGEVIMVRWKNVYGKGLKNEEISDMITIRFARFIAYAYNDMGELEKVSLSINYGKVSLLSSTTLNGEAATLVVVEGHDFLIPIRHDLVEHVLNDVDARNEWEFSKN